MAPQPETAVALRRAREDFLRRGDLAPAVRPDILSSWRRSTRSGADPEVPALPYSDDLDRESLLYDAAEPVLARLAERMDGTRTAILLADADARIMARWVGDRALLATMDRTESAPGFSLREEACGTNGLGSVLAARRPFFVVGSEHYADRFLDYACYGAPIHHPLSGRLQGILTFVCRAADSSPLMLAFVEATCGAVQDRMLVRLSRREGRSAPYLTAARHPQRGPQGLRERQGLQRRLGGTSLAWSHAMSVAARVLDSPHPVLVTGEPGVGKRELCRALHDLRGGPGGYHELNAALVPVDGLAAWLGRVRELLAGTGTLVLSHLEALGGPAPLALAALLDQRDQRDQRDRATGGMRPWVVGTLTTAPGQAAASGPHLDRLAVQRVELPPLRERAEDIPSLARRLLYRHAGDRLRLGPAALQSLQRAPWPGNVRQLDLVVRTLAAEHRTGTIGIADLPADVLDSARRGLTPMERLELRAIVGALRKAEGNKRLAAADLGISRSTLYRKLRAFHLDPERTAY